MKGKHAYKSIHEYMDVLFRNTIASDSDIVKAKEEYRKYYQKHYRKAYKQKYAQITFRISKIQYQVFEKIAQEKGIKLTTLLKQRALQIKISDNQKIKIQLSELLDYIEECIYENKKLNVARLLQELETIEQAL